MLIAILVSTAGRDVLLGENDVQRCISSPLDWESEGQIYGISCKSRSSGDHEEKTGSSKDSLLRE